MVISTIKSNHLESRKNIFLEHDGVRQIGF